MSADWATYYAYSLGWGTVRRMPEKRAYRLFESMADRVWKRRGNSILQYEKNIKRVVPDASPADLRDLSRACMRSYAQYWCDAFRMPDWSDEQLDAIEVTGYHHIVDAFESGSASPMFVTPHAGNYDSGAAFLATRFGNVTTVAERLKPAKLFDRFVEFRASRGVEIIPEGTPGIVDILAQRLREKKLVGVVGDRDLSRHGIPVTFFGEEARMPAGPAVLAQRVGTEILPVSFWYEGRAACAEIFPPISVPTDMEPQAAIVATTQAVADQLAVGIAKHPEDWHMLQPLWTGDLDPARDPMRRQASASQQSNGTQQGARGSDRG